MKNKYKKPIILFIIFTLAIIVFVMPISAGTVTDIAESEIDVTSCVHSLVFEFDEKTPSKLNGMPGFGGILFF